jgi:hypothetical protein
LIALAIERGFEVQSGLDASTAHKKIRNSAFLSEDLEEESDEHQKNEPP